MRKMQSRRGMAAVQTDGGVERRIHIIRGERVMLHADLATLYAVETGYLNLAVRRNRTRFPTDFMFQLTAEEPGALRSQIAISKAESRGGRRYLPYAFTEQGVAMLSSVLHSQRAIAANILIMPTFAQLRRAQGQYAELRQQLLELAHKSRATMSFSMDPQGARSACPAFAISVTANRVPTAHMTWVVRSRRPLARNSLPMVRRPQHRRPSDQSAVGLIRLLAVLVGRGQGRRWRDEPLQVVIRMRA